jgi:hypothetical protein
MPQQEDCRVGVQIGVSNKTGPTQIVEFKTKEQQQHTAPRPTADKRRTTARRPTYITQDDDDYVLPPQAMKT